jgi:prefoldin subunit 5
MAITGVNDYTSYTNYYTDTKQKGSSESAKKAADNQAAEKTYSNTREYRGYLTEKYDCLRNSDYSVAINSSLLSEATGDEKTAKWLEYNLSLIPETVEKTKAMVQARGGQIISYNITINGYDSMTAELCTKYEADPGTEKAREDLKERIKKIKEEKAEKEKKLEEKLEEKRAEKKANEEARTETPDYTVSATGTDIKTITQQVISISLGTSATTGGSFDIKA